MFTLSHILDDNPDDPRLEVLSLTVENDGIVMCFLLSDPFATVSCSRKIWNESLFVDMDDLIHELWCSPNLREITRT